MIQMTIWDKERCIMLSDIGNDEKALYRHMWEHFPDELRSKVGHITVSVVPPQACFAEELRSPEQVAEALQTAMEHLALLHADKSSVMQLPSTSSELLN